MKYMTCAVCVCSLLLTGCFGASTDPHEGGLFGYSPEAYQQRQREQRARLSYLNDENDRLRVEQADLQQSRSTASREVSDLQAKQKSLRNEKAALDKKLAQAKAANAADEKKLASLRARSQELSRRMNAKPAGDTASREQQIARLRQELRALERESASVGRL